MAGSSRIPQAAPAPPSLKKSTSSSMSSKSQMSIAGFFQKKLAEPSNISSPGSNGSTLPGAANIVLASKKIKKSTQGSDQSLTPAPSSDPVEHDDVTESRPVMKSGRSKPNGLPSPVTPAGVPNGFYSPSRKVGHPGASSSSRSDTILSRRRR